MQQADPINDGRMPAAAATARVVSSLPRVSQVPNVPIDERTCPEAAANRRRVALTPVYLRYGRRPSYKPESPMRGHQHPRSKPIPGKQL